MTIQQTELTCDFSSLRVAVIDDDGESLLLVQTLFKSKGIYVDTFDNVREGVKAITKADYNLLLLDIMIPGDADGFELHKQLREEKIPIMILAFTAMTEQKDLDTARKQGFDGYISKPFDPKTIFILLRAFISTYRVWRGQAPCLPT